MSLFLNRCCSSIRCCHYYYLIPVFLFCCGGYCCSCSSSKLLVVESGFVLVDVDVFIVSVVVIYLTRSSLRAFSRDWSVFYRDAVV